MEPTPENGLRQTSRLMVDIVTTVPRGTLGHRIGLLADSNLLRLKPSLLVFLGLVSRVLTPGDPSASQGTRETSKARES